MVFEKVFLSIALILADPSKAGTEKLRESWKILNITGRQCFF